MSVVIVTWNRRHDLKELLDCLAAQEFDSFEMLVVDNGSTDGTKEMVCELFPTVRYLRLPSNFGLSVGRNTGVANSLGDILCFLDDDVLIPDTQLLAKGYRRLRERVDASLISCKLIDCVYEGGRAITADDADEAPGLPWQYYWKVTGGASFFRRETFGKIGYYDGFFRYGGEDWDLSYRLHRAGMRMLWCPDLKVHHKVPKERPWGRIQVRIFRNMVVAQLRYMPLLDALVFLSWQVPASGLRSLHEGWFAEYVKACGWLVLHLPWMLTYRQPVSRGVMRRWYYLRTHQAVDYGEVEASQMKAWDEHVFRKARWKRRASNLPGP